MREIYNLYREYIVTIHFLHCHTSHRGMKNFVRLKNDLKK